MSAEWSFGSPAPVPVKRRGRGLIISGGVLLAVAVVLGIAGLVVVGRSASGLVDGFSSTYSTPAAFDRVLEGGQSYTLFESVGPSRGEGVLTDPPSDAVATIDASAVTIEGPGGYPVPLLEPSMFDSGTYDDGTATFAPIGTFDAPTTGSYSITVSATGGDVLLTPGFGSIAKVGLGALVVGLAVLIGIVGLVLLIVGLVLRSRKPAAASPYAVNPYAGGYGTTPYGTPAVGEPYGAQPAPTPYPVQPEQQPAQPWTPQPAAPPPPAALPPAGWYPDPQRPGGQRYWDGARWTDHRA